MDGVTHGFLEDAPARPLFASYHRPPATAPARNIAYVLCMPLHLELIQSHRSMRECAETLAAAGFHVMRVNYDGTGESALSAPGAASITTDSDPGRVEAWLESVRRAVAAMAAIPGVEGVGLLGVRIGAAFALSTSTTIDIAQLVLWEPCAGAHYAREMEILASSSPQRVPGLVVAGGYGLTEQTLADLRPLDLEKMQPRGRPEVLLVQRDDRKPSPRLQQHLEKLGLPSTAVQLAGHKEMMVMPQKSVVPFPILAGIRDWALERSRPLPQGVTLPSPSPVKLALETIVDGTRWRAVQFGSAGHLFGVLTEPANGARSGLPAVLLLTGGVTPRTAGNGSYVALARRLAAKGHAVLRMDVSNIGESGTPGGPPGDPNANDPFPPSIVDDARAGLERVCAAVASGTKVWVLGLCSGAYAAFHVIVGDPRARGVFFLNPERFDLPEPGGGGAGADDGAAAMSTVDQLEQMKHYWQVMRSPESWKKLLSGKADVRNLANVVRARVTSRLEATTERIAVRLGREPKGLAADLGKLLASGVGVSFVFSEGDPGHAAVLAELGARLDELVSKGMRLKTFAGADHNFHEMSSRAELLDWLEATIG